MYILHSSFIDTCSISKTTERPLDIYRWWFNAGSNKRQLTCLKRFTTIKSLLYFFEWIVQKVIIT